MNILIAEDDRDVCEVLRSYALEAGLTPLIAHNGEHALEIYHQKMPRLILLDITLPLRDGLSVGRKITEMEIQAGPSPRAKIIFLTEASAVHDRESAQRHGGLDFITKPVHRQDFFDKISHSSEK